MVTYVHDNNSIKNNNNINNNNNNNNNNSDDDSGDDSDDGDYNNNACDKDYYRLFRNSLVLLTSASAIGEREYLLSKSNLNHRVYIASE